MANIRVLTKLDNLNTQDIITDSLKAKELRIANQDPSILRINKDKQRVGILLDDPQHELHVNGTVAAKTKSFIIPHPLDPENKLLRYGSLESPYHGIRLTGRSFTQDGISIVTLPNYICALVKEEEVSIQITNFKHDHILFIDEIDILNNSFTVKSHCYSKLEFFWSFTAVRKDVPDMIVEFFPKSQN